MQRVPHINTKIIEEHIFGEIKKDEQQQLIVTGVCGICRTEYSSYKKAVNCCIHLKGKDYVGKINQVFQM